MEKKTYNIFQILMIVLILGGIWISNGNLILAFLFVITGMILLYMASQNVNETMWDERNILIKSNASRMAAGLFLFLMFFSGFALIVLNNSYPDYAAKGFALLNASNLEFTLSMGILLFWALYAGFYEYYKRKYGQY